MRPQQNRRINNNNNRRHNNGMRRAPNPLTRNYESSGPDVKIRGNAQHIADKYITLARDAQASGDRIMSENYLQHAEHYTRIILAAQPAEKDNRSQSRADNDTKNTDDNTSQNSEDLAAAAQPIIDGVPSEVALVNKNNAHTSDGVEASNDEEKIERPRPKRRLPARRSNQANRRSPSDNRDETTLSADSEQEAKPVVRRTRTPRKSPVSDNGAEVNTTEEKPARPRKPRRSTKTEAATTESEQLDV